MHSPYRLEQIELAKEHEAAQRFKTRFPDSGYKKNDNGTWSVWISGVKNRGRYHAGLGFTAPAAFKAADAATDQLLKDGKMHENQYTTEYWASATFPDTNNIHDRAICLVEEAAEAALALGCKPEEIALAAAIPAARGVEADTSREAILEELGDIAIMLNILCTKYNTTPQDVLSAKMLKNRNKTAAYYAGKQAAKRKHGMPFTREAQ